jgi:hypothetical protein
MDKLSHHGQILLLILTEHRNGVHAGKVHLALAFPFKNKRVRLGNHRTRLKKPPNKKKNIFRPIPYFLFAQVLAQRIGRLLKGRGGVPVLLGDNARRGNLRLVHHVGLLHVSIEKDLMRIVKG